MKKILLVNSMQAALEKEKSLLNRADVHVLTAMTGREALRIHRTEKVSLIVADLDMADMGGDELCSLVRKEKVIRDVSFILACRDVQVEIERATRCGANAWVRKPVQPEQLLEKVEQLLAISTRRGYRVLLRVRVHGSTDNTTFFCTSQNISISGMLIETEKLLDVGNRITCMFFLPGTSQIAADAEVVRCVPVKGGSSQYGVRFVDLAPECREEIERFIATSSGLL
ncbi:MAG TPA: PilZ domain-containing protein [Geobacteraceae bacterium]